MLCGTAADANSGVASNRLTIQRSDNNQWWTGSTWSNTQTTLNATGTTTWTFGFNSNQLTNGVTYTVTAWSVDTAGNLSANTVNTFRWDTTGPTTTAANLVTTNKNGAINASTDTFAVTFNEPLNPTSVPATGTLTLSRSNGNTSWGISGLTDGTHTTGGTGYLTSNFPQTRTITYAGSLALSNNNQTVTFTITGACSGYLHLGEHDTELRRLPVRARDDTAGHGGQRAVDTAPSPPPRR